MSAGGRRVLLADGAPPAALAAARSLVAAGFRVEATRARFSDRAPRSRGVRAIPAPSPTEDPRGFAEALETACRAGERPWVLPLTDAALLAVEARREALEAVADLAIPPPAVLRRALDKRETLEAARAAGLPVPETFVATAAGDADRCGLEPPLVAKPLASRWRGAGGGVRGAGPAFARSKEDLRGILDGLFAAGAPGALVQRWLPGTGWGVGLLMRRESRSPANSVDGVPGRAVAAVGAELAPPSRGERHGPDRGVVAPSDLVPAAVFVHRRLREVHPAGGPSAAAVSEAPDPALVEPAVALLRTMEWEGLAMVEFRREGDGRPVLMEVNGRPWGTMGLAVDAGVDFPRLLLEGYAGPPPSYREGLRRRWLAGDLRRARAAWVGPPPGYPGRFPSAGRAFADLLFGGARDFVFRWNDPLPFLAEMAGGIL